MGSLVDSGVRQTLVGAQCLSPESSSSSRVGAQILEVDTAVVVSVQRVRMDSLVQALVVVQALVQALVVVQALVQALVVAQALVDSGVGAQVLSVDTAVVVSVQRVVVSSLVQALVVVQALVQALVVAHTLVDSRVGVQVLSVDTAVVVSVQRVVVSSLVQALLGVYASGRGLAHLAQVESLSTESVQIAADDSAILHGSCLTVDGGGVDVLLVDGLSVLDDGGLDDVALQDGLNLLDDSLLDHLVDDGGMCDLAAHGGIGMNAGCMVVLLNGGSSLDDGLAVLGGQLALVYEGGLNLGLVEHLGDLLDIELLALSVDDGLDLLLLHGVESLVNDDVLLNVLDDGGLAACHTGSSGALDICTTAGVAAQILRVDTAVVVSVQRVVVSSLVQALVVA